jgi:hypothetical protein
MHCLRIVPCLVVAAVLAGFPTAPVLAQRPSQHGSVSQRIGNTVVTIEYNRPVARGRDLFGALVPYGKIWHPGADEASHITVSTDVKVNGQPLAAGTYSLWTEPNPGQWTFIFSRAHPVYHTPYPEGQDVLRVPVTPRTGQHMETMAFYFPIVEGKRAELALHWGVVIVSLVLEVP